MNVPGIYVYAGTIKPGKWKGQDLTIVSAFEAVGAYTAGKMSKDDFVGIEKNACPTVGACGGMFTANTMSSSFEALGMSLSWFLGILASPDAVRALDAFGEVAAGRQCRYRSTSSCLTFGIRGKAAWQTARAENASGGSRCCTPGWTR